MRQVKLDKVIFVIVILTSSCFLSILNVEKEASAENPDPFFSISILAPNTNPARNQWATLMVEQLPKIGIGIDVFDHTGWAQIAPRTWNYPGPYPIPSYADGGFDLFFVGWSWDLDISLTGLFDTASITPDGDNFYQYSSSEMDLALSEYDQAYNFADRQQYAEEIQALLYEDLPQTTIIYPYSNYIHDVNFEGWDGLLWASSYQPMEAWEIAGQTEFRYATPADFEDFHIYKYESVYDAQWLSQIYNGLAARNAAEPYNRNYAPRLAASYDSTDGLTYNIVIDADATWQDGTDLTSADVEFSYNLQIDPDFGNPSLSYWQKYINSTSITITDSKHLTITFLEEYNFQDGNLALDLVPEHIWSAILPEDMEAQAVTWATSDPTKLMGAGPYYLYDYNGTNAVIHLKRNDYFDDWSDVTPFFEDIYFEFYSNKEGALSDLASGAIDMVDSQFSVQLYEIPTGTTNTLVDDPGVQEMAFNCEHPYLGTGELCPISSPESGKHIRKAISHMIPRQYCVDYIINGLGRPGVTAWPTTGVFFDDSLEPFEYNITLAMQHMEEAGYVYQYPSPTPTQIPVTPTTPTSEIQVVFYIGLAIFVSTISILTMLRRIRKR